MDLYHKLLMGLSLVLIFGAMFFGWHWLQAHDAFIQAQAEAKATKDALSKISDQQKAFNDRLNQLQADQQKALADVAKNFSQAQSPAQLSALLSQIMKQPVTVVTPTPTPGNPTPAPMIQLPDTPQAKAYFQECEDCKIKLTTAQQQITVSQSQAALDKQRVELITQDRDNWKKAASGGSWAQRAWKRAGHFLIDAGITTAIVCGSGHCK